MGNSERNIDAEIPFGIPDSWRWCRLNYLCTLKNGRAFKPSDWSSVGVPIVRIQNLNDVHQSFNFYSGVVADEYKLCGGELLFAWSGTPGTSFGSHIWHGGEAVLNQHIFRIDFNEALISKEYLMYAINHRLNALISAAHGGAGLQHITKGVFEFTFIPLPPFSEQQRIIEHIRLLTRQYPSILENLN